jgi:hypothetical protein
MSRSLPTGFAALTEGDVFRPVFLVELAWPSGTVNAWNGYGSISWDSKTWVGTGHLGAISDIGESSDLAANGLTLQLSGIPSSLITEAMADDSQGQPAKIWLGCLAKDGTFAADPYLIFDGVIDVCTLQDDGPTATIQVKIEKELIDRRLNNRRYTHEDQQIDYAGDLFFEFVAGLADKEITWGTKTQPASGLPPGAVYPTGVGMVQFE